MDAHKVWTGHKRAIIIAGLLIMLTGLLLWLGVPFLKEDLPNASVKAGQIGTWQKAEKGAARTSAGSKGKLYNVLPKDAIPAILHPKFIYAHEADSFLKADDTVLGLVSKKGVAKAYPLKILTKHEAVNDFLGGQPIVVTY